MLTILLPVDGSKHAERAVRHVIRLHAKGLACEALLLHVQPALPPHSSPRSKRRSAVLRQLDAGEAALRPALTLLERAGVPCRSLSQSGAPAECILKMASGKSCAMIVMGTRGLGAVAGFVLGSVAMKVIQLARVPVTLVK